MCRGPGSAGIVGVSELTQRRRRGTGRQSCSASYCALSMCCWPVAYGMRGGQTGRVRRVLSGAGAGLGPCGGRGS